jgi:ribosomal protein S18 acetylase RimI-like enzyme
MATGIEIRPCRPTEASAVLDLWQRAASRLSPTDDLEGLAKVLAHPTALLLVAVDVESIVGSVIAGWDGWRGNLYRLVVAPDYRRRGLAQALVLEAERRLARWGARRISAFVEGNIPGRWDSGTRCTSTRWERCAMSRTG